MIKRLTMALAVLSFCAAVVVSGMHIAGAVQVISEDKVTICHRTNSATNPYVRITVDKSAADGQGNNDHSQHTGPVATTTQVAQTYKDNHIKWGDIIPDVPGVTPVNWNTDGMAVYNNGCLGGTEITEVTPAAVTFTAPTCDKLGSYTIPATEHVKYMVNGEVVAAGTYTVQNGTTVTVTAVADQGFFIGDETTDTFSNTFTAPTNCGGGQGGGTVLGATTTAGVAATPAGGVNAGTGGVSTLSLGALIGLTASIGSLGLGVRRLGKSEL
jgi:hypothetical protein